MKIKMLTSTMGAADASGATVKSYQAGEELPLSQPWQQKLAETFVEMGVACEIADQVQVDEVKMDQDEKPKRRVRRKKSTESKGD